MDWVFHSEISKKDKQHGIKKLHPSAINTMFRHSYVLLDPKVNAANVFSNNREFIVRYYSVLISFEFKWEAPWSSGERWGLTVWAMVLGRKFNFQVHLKTRWIRRTYLMAEKNEKNKNSQKGQVTPRFEFNVLLFDFITFPSNAHLRSFPPHLQLRGSII